MGKATERRETGRDCRAGVWQELGALSRRAIGEQVPGGGRRLVWVHSIGIFATVNYNSKVGILF